jgi:hypothetical protein
MSRPTDYVQAGRAGDYQASSNLRDLLTATAVERLDVRHPLKAGFDALQRFESHVELSDEHRLELYSLDLYARTAFAFEQDWRTSSERVRDGLLSLSTAPSVLFELNVAAFALIPNTAEVHWVAYDDSQPDLRCHGPRADVECKLAESDSNLDDVKVYLRKVDHQHADHPVSLMAAVGFDMVFDETQLDRALRSAERRIPWMRGHPNIAGALIFGRRPHSNVVESVGGAVGRRFRDQTIYEVRNHSATHALPRDFRFGHGPQIRGYA